MGCVNSRTDINNHHSNIFQVMNVDDLGNLITPGRLEITELDIVLYQRGKNPVNWPLRCLRRYGYDSEIFSFESGRRCSTGPGIYAFKCRKADQLFNLVQTNIQACNNSGDDAISRDLSMPPHSGPVIPRMTIPTEPNYLDPVPIRLPNHPGPRLPQNQHNGVTRLGSGSSSGPISPQGTLGTPSPPPMSLPLLPPISQQNPSALYVNEGVLSALTMEMEHNNNKSPGRPLHRSCTNESTTSSIGVMSESTAIQSTQEVHHNRPPPLAMASYMNIDLTSDASPLSPSHSMQMSTPLKEDINEIDTCHAYMNISPGNENIDSSVSPTTFVRVRTPLTPLSADWDEYSRHCYANLEPGEIETLRMKIPSISGNPEKSPLPPTTPSAESVKEVNYAILDLDKNNISTAITPDGITNNLLPSPPDSPNKSYPQKGYATIDFNKTAALSHSVNPNVVNDNEGSRKTRHNSTINDLNTPSRQSSSISE